MQLPQLKGSDVLTGSRIQCYQTCPRKHHYEYNLGIRRAKIAHYFRIGTAGHIGIELRAKGESVENAIVGATATYNQYPHWARTEEQRHEWDCERAIVANLLAGYFWYWERDNLPADIDIKSYVVAEQSFHLPIVNPETGKSTKIFHRAGKMDGVVQTKADRNALIEHKFISDDISPDSEYWLRLRIDNQISGYMSAAISLGQAVDEVLMDVIRKPTISPKQIPTLDESGFKIVIDQATGERMLKTNLKKDGTPGAGHGEPYQSANLEKGWILMTSIETPEQFSQRLYEDIIARPEFYYARKIIPRLDQDIEDYNEHLWQIQQQMQDSLKKGRHFRNTSACTDMGTCPYLNVCHLGDEIAVNIPEGFEQVQNIHEEL